jgi:hypothetical protein
MAPPKLGDPNRVARKTRSAMNSTQDQAAEGENPNQLEGVVDIDAIPSLVIEPISPMIVEEQNPTTEEMDIDQWGISKPHHRGKPHAANRARRNTTV